MIDYARCSEICLYDLITQTESAKDTLMASCDVKIEDTIRCNATMHEKKGTTSGFIGSNIVSPVILIFR